MVWFRFSLVLVWVFFICEGLGGMGVMRDVGGLFFRICLGGLVIDVRVWGCRRL